MWQSPSGSGVFAAGSRDVSPRQPRELAPVTPGVFKPPKKAGAGRSGGGTLHRMALRGHSSGPPIVPCLGPPHPLLEQEPGWGCCRLVGCRWPPSPAQAFWGTKGTLCACQ